jgi:hypothetical protein
MDHWSDRRDISFDSVTWIEKSIQDGNGKVAIKVTDRRVPADIEGDIQAPVRGLRIEVRACQARPSAF